MAARALPCPDNSLYSAQYENTNHGRMSRQQAEMLLTSHPECDFLVRESERQPGFSLSMNINGSIKHYKILFEDGQHFVEKSNRRFNTIYELVADGLDAMAAPDAGPPPSVPPRTAFPAPASVSSAPVPPAKPPKNLPVGMSSNPRVQPPVPLSSAAVPPRQPSPPLGSRLPAEDNMSPPPASAGLTSAPSYVKDHKLEVVTFTHFTWCLHCKGLLWGLKSQGLKCKDCGYTCHRLCKDLAGACVPLKKHLKKVFGTDLTFIVVVSESRYPILVEKCINEVAKRGMHEEGIYRISPSASEVQALRDAFERDHTTADVSSVADINVVSALLKAYIRELPNPLIPFEFFDRFLATAKSSQTPAEQLIEYQKHIADLPAPHYETLKFLMSHLNDVVAQSAVNKMNASNLGVVFGLSIFRGRNGEELPESKLLATVVGVMITDCAKLFVA
ncbi:chimerin 1 [Capsaspora owczarzaki ATCC 30864]|uniref:Chimerin 1 n=1 Tax=Capsaspora owczarzaki (strain ATCC 30864) TaxID=595528 RepID=A0A0D2WSH3_CAPO3|nr:chimerin 1 [Capsaspora owczarzaki ATCC 30864]KJE95095.1 chimerin 1 [Capsaspora owczarzaki ATCC 30864]|eukprot:XP_004346258.2 chimerin 1 [Capsaspora owczarzaki ATCC 30864]